ncbi:hypothetical protein FVE85_4469 [Porphyridium purpureum]|uniref:RNase III domain-containing protein n=1 Tax=Porphyridium purpureum TaxID=35688 RepID=A0A5J4YJ23_PORPP|nr:hypothetical protein FVE85_4469 [Porphyridium purpureum]|eukprot:POR8524..scf297_16
MIRRLRILGTGRPLTNVLARQFASAKEAAATRSRRRNAPRRQRMTAQMYGEDETGDQSRRSNGPGEDEMLASETMLPTGERRSRRVSSQPAAPKEELFLERGFQMGGLSPLRYMRPKRYSPRVAAIRARPEEREKEEREQAERAKLAAGPISSFEQDLERTGYGQMRRALLVSAERCRLKEAEPLNGRITWFRELIERYGYTMRNDMILRVALVDQSGATKRPASSRTTRHHLNRADFDAAFVGVLQERSVSSVVTNAQLAWLGDGVLSVLHRSRLLHALIVTDQGTDKLRRLTDAGADAPFTDARLAQLARNVWGVPRGHVRYAHTGISLELDDEVESGKDKKGLRNGPAENEAYGSLVEAVVGAVLLDSMKFGVAVEFARRAVAEHLQNHESKARLRLK